MKDLTLAQAVTVVALLAFAIGWFLMLDQTVDITEEDAAKMKDGAAVMMAILWFGPPVWAFWMVTDILRGDD